MPVFLGLVEDGCAVLVFVGDACFGDDSREHERDFILAAEPQPGLELGHQVLGDVQHTLRQPA